MKKPKTEAQVKRQVVTYLKKLGWVVVTLYTGGIPTKAGVLATNPAKGIPDLICFTPQGQLIWIELKRETGGVVSKDQAKFHGLLRSCNQIVLVISNLDQMKEYTGHKRRGIVAA